MMGHALRAMCASITTACAKKRMTTTTEFSIAMTYVQVEMILAIQMEMAYRMNAMRMIAVAAIPTNGSMSVKME
ncbi:MAG: hypothetical protein ACXAE3_17480 [Candidatus Kariarchaeaceae archaeon]|jgi:hypothetical protein